MMSSFDNQEQCEEYFGTFKGEPASEDAWPSVWNTEEPEDDSMSPAQAFDILFGYSEERHCNDPCAQSLSK